MNKPATGPVIDLHGVRKTYRGGVQALAGVDVRIEPGEIFGLLGPNGAGKSTLVKIMMTIVRADTAEGTLLGMPLGHRRTLARVGYLPEHHRLPAYLTGRQALHFCGTLSHVPRRILLKRIEELLDMVGMTAWADRAVGTYSKGMMQRVGIAQALVNAPDLVMLDEPTDGVDPVGRKEIRDMLLRMREQGMTVFLNSHLLSELEMLCDRVAIIVQGKCSLHGTLEDLTKGSAHYAIEIEGDAPAWSKEHPGLQVTASESGGAMLTVDTLDARDVQPLIDRLRQSGHVIISACPVRESLEDLFLRTIIDPDTGAPPAPGAAPLPGDES